MLTRHLFSFGNAVSEGESDASGPNAAALKGLLKAFAVLAPKRLEGNPSGAGLVPKPVRRSTASRFATSVPPNLVTNMQGFLHKYSYSFTALIR